MLAQEASAAMEAEARRGTLAGMRVARVGAGELREAEAEGVLAGWFQRHGVLAAIVRPDHYVFGVAASADELTGQLAGLGEVLQLEAVPA